MKCFIILLLLCYAIPKKSFLKKAGVCKYPVIGILTSPIGKEKETGNIDLNYVAWLQKSGARIVPIKHWTKEKDLYELLNKLNGILFQGNVEFDKKSDYTKTAFSIVDYAKANYEKKLNFAVFGIGTGMHLIAHDCFKKEKETKYFYKNAIPIKNIMIKGNASNSVKSKILTYLTNSAKNIFTNQDSTFHNHSYSLNSKVLKDTKAFSGSFNIVSTADNPRDSTDFYVNIIEGKKGLPIYGTQFHPEKMLNEFYRIDPKIKVINDESSFNDANILAQSFGNFFVSAAAGQAGLCLSDTDFKHLGGIQFNVELQYEKMKKILRQWDPKCGMFIYSKNSNLPAYQCSVK